MWQNEEDTRKHDYEMINVNFSFNSLKSNRIELKVFLFQCAIHSQCEDLKVIVRVCAQQPSECNLN